MKPTLQKNIPALSGKSREERGAIFWALMKTDSKLKFYRKIFLGMFIATPIFMSSFIDSHVTIMIEILIIAFVVIVTSTFLQLFCVNPRLKEILEDKN